VTKVSSIIMNGISKRKLATACRHLVPP
jgi:hypothetical protein